MGDTEASSKKQLAPIPELLPPQLLESTGDRDTTQGLTAAPSAALPCVDQQEPSRDDLVLHLLKPCAMCVVGMMCAVWYVVCVVGV